MKKAATYNWMVWMTIRCSVSYRIAVGPQQGRKVLTLQTLQAVEADDRYAQVAKEAGLSLQAGVAAQAWERDKLERLCRYISKPAVLEKRLSLTLAGNIRYQLKTAYRESLPHERSECFGYGTTHVAVLTHPCTSYMNHWILCTGSTVYRGRMDAQERTLQN
jgi:hypothetical protein